MIRTGQIDSLLKTDEGKYYKKVSDDILTNYIYNHSMDSYSSGTRADGINGNFGKMLAKSPKKDIGFSSFEDFYDAYRDSIRSDLLNKQKYSSKYLKIDEGVQKSLPKLPNEIKIAGTDIDNDSYVYADALYQTLINKDDKGKDIYEQLGIFDKKDKDAYSKTVKKSMSDSLKNYLKFESRKLAAVYYTGSDRYKANRISANSKKKASSGANDFDMTPVESLAIATGGYNADSNASVIQRLLPVDDNFKTNESKLNKLIKSKAYVKNNDLGTLYAAEHQAELQNKIKEMAENVMNGTATDSFSNKVSTSSDGIKVKNANSKDKNVDSSSIKIKIDDNGNISVPHGAEYTTIKSANDITNIAIGSGYTDAQYLNAIKSYCEKNGYTLNTTTFKAVKAGAGSRIQDMVAGATNGFVSQLDYKNMKFADGESMAEAGCGPAVAAMALNGLQGGASMVDTAPLANKYKVQGGTDANYFRDIMSRNGVGTKYYEGSKAKAGVTDALKKGQQAVILGQDSSNRSKANSPFGPGNHYVLAKGMGGGKVAINDPEQHGTKLYDKKILKNAKLGIAIQGKGSGVIHKALKDKTGFIGGASYSQSLKHANLAKWSKPSVAEFRKAVENYHGSCKISKNIQVFLDAAEASGLDPRFLVALAAQETGWDSNANACGRANNVFDIAAYDSNPFNKDSTGTYGAATYKDGVCKGAVWIADHYYKRGQTTVYLMRHNNGSHEYCTSTTWEDKIAQIMSRMPNNSKVSFDSKSVKLDGKGYTSTGGNDSSSSSSSSSSSGSTWQDKLVDAVNGMSDAMFGMVTGGEADGLSNSSSEGSASAESNGTWVSTVAAVKKAMCRASGGKYSQAAKCNITINGKSFSARTDCTGFVSACLKAFGVDIGSPDSRTFTRGINIKGFTKMKWPGWDKLVKGDIMARNGHAEIFSHNEGGQHKVWNFGSKYSAPVEGITGSSHPSYTVIYRCNSNKGKGSGISLYDVIRSTRKKISASSNRGKGSGIHSASKMNEIALQKISKAYSSNNKKNSYSTQNIQKVNKSMTGKGSYKAGTTFAQVMSSAKSGAGYTHKNETVTMFHPETGAVIDVPYAAAGSAMDLGYVAGATKVKGVRSKKKVTAGNNLANTNMLIKTVIQLLASIDKSEKKNTEIVAVLRKLYTLQQQQSSESSSKKKKKGKGSELYGGDSEVDENTVISSTTPSASTSSKSVNSSSSTTSTITEEDDSITGLINSLMNIIVD